MFRSTSSSVFSAVCTAIFIKSCCLFEAGQQGRARGTVCEISNILSQFGPLEEQSVVIIHFASCYIFLTLYITFSPTYYVRYRDCMEGICPCVETYLLPLEIQLLTPRTTVCTELIRLWWRAVFFGLWHCKCMCGIHSSQRFQCICGSKLFRVKRVKGREKAISCVGRIGSGS
jgi:hypothetical protein